MPEITAIDDVVNVLKSAKTVAVIGFHPDKTKPSHYVPEYLYRRGYKIIAINPKLARDGASYFGHEVVASVQDVAEFVDVVEIFRRSDKVHEHVEEILNMPHKPKTVWMQQGIRDDQVAEKLVQHGINVIQDRCMLADHRHYL